MNQSLTWKDVLYPHSWNLDNVYKTQRCATHAGYKYFVHNGGVYETLPEWHADHVVCKLEDVK